MTELHVDRMIARHTTGTAHRGHCRNARQLPAIQAVADELIRCLDAGGVLYTYGNGGSAADAQHLVGELIGRYLRERRPLPAVALIGDAAVVSCIANDYSYDDVFARQVRALARPADMVIGFSTSGTSPTVVRGLAAARAAGACSVAYHLQPRTGASGCCGPWRSSYRLRRRPGSRRCICFRCT